MPGTCAGVSQISSSYHLAYVFERFPTFTQTFCVREILELERQGLRPLIFSLSDTRHEQTQSYPAELRNRVHYLPEKEELTRFVRRLRTEKRVPKPVDHTLRYWQQQPDKRRVYEAAYIGHKIRQIAPNLRHAHCHFAGKAARTLWWLRHFHRLTYSFTAHANDVFCAETDTEVTLPMLMRDASRIVTVSDYTVRRLSAEFPAARRKIRRVYNGLDLEKWVRANRGRPAGIGSRRIYSVGRLIEKKGFDDLIRASAILRDRGIAHTCHIIGGGPLETELRGQIRAENLEKTVILEGEQDQDAIITALANRAHLFALPCVTERGGGMDNLPTVIMEAMAIGLPCVSTRLAGVPEMVVEGQTGLLTNERQPEAFADCLQTLLQDAELCQKLGQRATHLAAERFDKSVTTSQLKRALISGGLVRFDPELTYESPSLARSYLAQWPIYLAHLLRPGTGYNARRMLDPAGKPSHALA